MLGRSMLRVLREVLLVLEQKLLISCWSLLNPKHWTVLCVLLTWTLNLTNWTRRPKDRANPPSPPATKKYRTQVLELAQDLSKHLVILHQNLLHTWLPLWIVLFMGLPQTKRKKQICSFLCDLLNLRARILGKTGWLRRLVLFKLSANFRKEDQAAYCSALGAIFYNTAKSQICIDLVELYIYFVQCVKH